MDPHEQVNLFPSVLSYRPGFRRIAIPGAGKEAALAIPISRTKPASLLRAARVLRAWAWGLRAAMAMGWLVALAGGPALGEVQLPPSLASEPILVTAQAGTRWTQGSYEVWVLQGGCRIAQGHDTAASREAVLWILRHGPTEHGRNKVIAYLEGDVAVDVGQGAPARLTDKTWLGRLATAASVEVRVSREFPPPQTRPAIYDRGMAQRDPDAIAGHRADYAAPAAPASDLPPGARRIRVFPRSDVRTQAQWFPDRATNQWIAVIESGVNVIIEGLTLPEQPGMPQLLRSAPVGTIDVSTDRMVIWTTGGDEPDLAGNRLQPNNVPLEIYMEGNIVFRQGDRIIYADRMYYDVTNQVGTVLSAELLTPVPKYEGLLRLRAEAIRQLDRDHFYAEHAYVTSSRIGAPSYRLQAGSATLVDRQVPRLDPVTGAPIVDPETGEVQTQPERLATLDNSFLYLDDLPVFYWPTFATDLEESSFYVRRIRLRHDNVFGTQALVDLNMYQILGLRSPPKGTDWGASLDYLSRRGFGHGTNFSYHRDGFLGIAGPAAGLWDYWGIADHGADNLGLDRRSVPPEKDYRFRLFGQHRQMLAGDVQLSGEVGLISDHNFLEQYYEREWYELKDESTGLELKKIRDNTAWSIALDYRLYDFVTQTDWLPRGDHFWLGQSLLGDRLTWFEHTTVGYGQFRTLDAPAAAQNPGDKFRYLPWETTPGGVPTSPAGERFATRHELDLPFQLGVVKFVPYVLGEFAHWGEDLSGDDLQRLYGQVGVRASVPMWSVDPSVQSVLWNLNGIAHKVVFDAEFSFADANRDLTALPLYDPLDDDSIEAFRRRFVPNTFPAPLGSLPPSPAIPLAFDERFYALRTGMAGWVTAPTEIADDLTAFRLGMRHRWQTKRGTPGQQRIVDWITLDSNLVLFPDKDRDNFGQALGLLDYNARWQVGDRLALLSSGIFDFFHDGQRLISVGGFLDRPPRGGLYLGVRLLDGPISNTILSMSYSYRMSPKWVSAFSTSIDLRRQGNIGQNFTITRVGESFLLSAGFHADASRGSYGASFAVEPRFLPKTRLGHAGGARIPTAGAFGLE